MAKKNQFRVETENFETETAMYGDRNEAPGDRGLEKMGNIDWKHLPSSLYPDQVTCEGEGGGWGDSDND